MRHRFAFFAVLAALVLTAAGCAGDASSGQAAAPATTAAAPGPTTAPPTTVPTTTEPPSQVQVPDLIGRRPRVARAELEALGLQVNEARVPVQDPRQANRVVLQNPPPGTTVGPGSTVTIVVGVGFRND